MSERHPHRPQPVRDLHDGVEDKLEALRPLDPNEIHSFDDLLRAMSKTAFKPSFNRRDS